MSTKTTKPDTRLFIGCQEDEATRLKRIKTCRFPDCKAEACYITANGSLRICGQCGRVQ